jgi:hypothetical protein
MKSGELTLSGWNNESFTAPLPKPGKMPVWQSHTYNNLVDYWKENRQLLYERGVIARLTQDGKTLEYRQAGKVIACALPAEAVNHRDDTFSARYASDTATAVCHEGGRVETVWPGKRGKRSAGYWQRRGDAWLAERPHTLFLLSTDGRFLPPINLQKFWPDAPVSLQDSHLPGVQVLRIDGATVWLTLGGKSLVKLDGATGEATGQWPLPPFGPLEWNETYYDKVTGTGFFHTTRERIYFVTWDGAIRDLGPAMAE